MKQLDEQKAKIGQEASQLSTYQQKVGKLEKQLDDYTKQLEVMNRQQRRVGSVHTQHIHTILSCHSLCITYVLGFMPHRANSREVYGTYVQYVYHMLVHVKLNHANPILCGLVHAQYSCVRNTMQLTSVHHS